MRRAYLAQPLHALDIIVVTPGFATTDNVADGAMHKQVGIATNRRREMCVSIERQTEMADVLRCVFGVRQRPQHRH